MASQCENCSKVFFLNFFFCIVSFFRANHLQAAWGLIVKANEYRLNETFIEEAKFYWKKVLNFWFCRSKNYIPRMFRGPRMMR